MCGDSQADNNKDIGIVMFAIRILSDERDPAFTPEIRRSFTENEKSKRYVLDT